MDGELKNLWKRLREPLVLCARDAFARLDDIKNVEAALEARARQLCRALESAGESACARGVAKIAERFLGFAGKPTAQKRVIVTAALAALAELEASCLAALTRPVETAVKTNAQGAIKVALEAAVPTGASTAAGALPPPALAASNVAPNILSPRGVKPSIVPSPGEKALVGSARDGVTRRAAAGGADWTAEAERQKLAAPVQFLKGVGPRFAALLAKKGVNTIEDFLYFLPRRYEDRRRLCGVADAPLGVRASVIGKVLSAGFVFRGRRRVFEALIGDHRQQLRATWFQGSFVFLAKNLQPDVHVLLTGEVRLYGYIKTMVHPDWEVLEDGEAELKDSSHSRRLVPVYSETEGLSSKTLRRLMQGALASHAGLLAEELPPSVVQRQGLMLLSAAVRQAHFPPDEANLEALNAARSDYHRRIIYEEFFFLQLGMGVKRSSQALMPGIAFRLDEGLRERFQRSLPFVLTGAQHRVIAEIAQDMQKPTAMSRLLQGDVGSGKTLVAFAAMLIACGSGFQAVLMVPTELLAQQHFANLHTRAAALGFPAVLLAGSLPAAQKRAALAEIASGRARIIIGTHALLYEQVAFAQLGLVVIDEQHRFGVAQRARIRDKGANPDVLVMTATPIPRTLAMSIYGDLDVSILDELPPHRKPVKTKLYFESQRAQVYELIRKEVAKGSQVFIVYPLVEESDALGLKDASKMAEHLQTAIFPEFVVGLVHGRLKPRARVAMMEKFQRGEINILAATTVIEVGIDIPEASVMVIENAERFGLSQLHQLRGRVGRGKAQSYCLLLAQPTNSGEARRRLQVMETTNDGFQIAEADLAIRGPGEFMGVRQAGIPDFRVGDIVRDVKLLAQAQADAQTLLQDDARLERPEHRHLWAALQRRWQGRLNFARTG